MDGTVSDEDLLSIWSEMRWAAIDLWNEPGFGFDGHNHMCFQYAQAMYEAGRDIDNQTKSRYIILTPRISRVVNPTHYVVDIIDPVTKKYLMFHVGSGLNPTWHTRRDNDWPIKIDFYRSKLLRPFDPPVFP